MTLAALVGGLLLPELSALAQVPPPANDNFADASEMVGEVGILTGDNSGATLQAFELNTNGVALLQGVRVDGTVWYRWTAPETGDFQFNTSGSIVPVALGVFEGASETNLLRTPANSSFVSPIQSSLNVTVLSNQVYYIKLGSTQFVPDMAGGTNASTNMVVVLGTYQLSWRRTSGYPSFGDFSFSSQVYVVSDSDNGYRDHNWMEPSRRPTATIVRNGGSFGVVHIRYNVTNDWYTNEVILNVFGTNISKADGTVVANYTNFVRTVDQEHMVDGSRVRGERTIVLGTYTNFVGGNLEDGSLQPPITILADNLTYTNNDDVYLVFSLPATTNYVGVPSAVAKVTPNDPNGDFTPVIDGEVTFSNFQMSAAIEVPVGVRFPRGGPLLNAAIKVEIVSIEADQMESFDLAPPTVSQASSLINAERSQVLKSSGLRGTNVFNFERSNERVKEDARGVGSARVHVRRTTADASGTTTVNYRIDYSYPYERFNNFFTVFPGSEYATPENPTQNKYGPVNDFTTVEGTLTFGRDDFDEYIDIPLIDDNLVEFNEDIYIELWLPPETTDRWVGYVDSCVLTIDFDEQPAGAVDREHNMDNDPTTEPPYNPNPGANSTVYSVVALEDGSSLIAGDFTAYNAAPRNRVARLRADGQLDRGFDPGDGADAFVSAMKIDSEGRILIAGAFTSYNRTTRNGIARLLESGALDLSFDPGLGVDGSVWAMAFAPDDSIYIAGSFNTVNATNRNYIARLKADGSLDSSFDPGAGPNGPIYAVAVTPEGKVYIGGQFSHVGGVARSCIARLNEDGSLDMSFNPRSAVQGPLPTVFTIALESGKLMIGGSFTSVYGVARSNLARLNADGSIDLSFDPGSGTDDMVYTISRLDDGKYLIGGSFTDYNETRRVGLARTYSNGILDTTFMDASYNQYAGVPTIYYNEMVEPRSFIFSTSVQADGKVLIGGNFDRVGGGIWRDDIRIRRNVARLIGGETPGPGNIELAESNYNVDNPIKEGQQNVLFLKMNRLNGSLASATVTAQPYRSGDGVGNAQPGVDYVDVTSSPTWLTMWQDSWQVSEGTYGQNNGDTPWGNGTRKADYPFNDLKLTTEYNSTRGNRSLGMRLSNPRSSLLLGGEPIPVGVALGRRQAEILIVDNARDNGTLSFSAASYFVNEGTNAYITVTRTDGSDDRVMVRYATENLGATNGVHYTGVTNWLVFNAGVTSQTFTVQTKDRTVMEKNQTIKLRLSDPAGGASLGLTNAILTIVDNDVVGGYVEFSSATYMTNESAGVAQVTVRRLGSSTGVLSVKMSTLDKQAVAGVNYEPVYTNLVWNSGNAAPKVINIPILRDGLYQDTNFLTIGLVLTNPILGSVSSPVSLGTVKESVLTIVNEDYRGVLGFNQTDYLANENGGKVTITVVRTNGSAERLRVNYAANSLTAFDGLDFISTSGTMYFDAGEVSKSFDIQLIDNQIEDVDRQIALSLSGANPADVLGSAAAVVHLLDDETLNQPPGFVDTEVDPSLSVEGNVYSIVPQPDGRYLLAGDFVRVNDEPRNRIARINADGSLDTGFSSKESTAGANDSVLSMVHQTDGRVLIGGQFSYVNGVARNYLARLMANGMLDSSFNPGAGPESTVLAMAETFVDGSRRLLVGGAFATFNGLSRNFLVRLTDVGQVDPSFNPSLSPNGPVHCMVIDGEGRTIIGGDFTMVNGIQRMHIARILPNGVLDSTFDPGVGANDSVRSLVLQLDGKILAGGLFTQMGGLSAGYVARLHNNGQVDGSFVTGTGADDAVTVIAVQPDARILVGGQFKTFNSVTRHGLARLEADGSVDTTINLGTGANSFISAISLQADRRMWLGGGFTEWDGQPANHLVRIYGGSIAGPGALEFDAAEYFVGESGTNATLTIRRRGGTTGEASVTLATADATGVNGKNYIGTTTNLVFPPGETMEVVVIPVMRDYEITSDLKVVVTLADPQPQPGGPVLGNQPSATLFIVNEDSAINFSAANYLRNENAPEKSATITLVRSGSVEGTSTVDFLTTTNGTAGIGTNYWPVNRRVTFLPGESNAVVQVPLVYDPTSPGNLTVTMELTNAVNALLFSPSSAILTILDVDKMPGQFVLSQTNYVVSESAGTALITVVRTNGRSGTVTVNYNTLPGTAQPGVKYIGTNGVLVFGENELVKSFAVPLIQNTLVDGHLNFTVALSNPTGGSSFAGPSSSMVTIMDDDLGVGFASPVFLAAENSGSATLTLTRIGTNGVTTVQYYTTNSTAVAGTNYVAESGSITFTDGESLKLMSIDLLHDPRVSGDLSFNVVLHNPSAPAQLFNPSTAAVVVLDSDPGLAFTNAVFGVRKSDTNVLISVMRTNANTGNVTVRYATTNLTALAGVDYAAASGQLTFSNGIAMQSFTIPIINNRLLQEDLEFGIRLFNPTDGAKVIEPSFARVIITNDISGFSFSSPVYTVRENGVSREVTVRRTGFLENTVVVDYTTRDFDNADSRPDAARAGVNYVATSGTFIFTNGETVKTFEVPITDNSKLEGNKSFMVGLSPRQGNAVAVDPSAATITIIENDGSLIVPAGAVLVSESGPVNGMIDTNETVTMLFSLRNASGTNTANLTASLLATNGVVNPSGPRTYGVLLTNGASAHQPFTFTANATNGQTIRAFLRVADGEFTSQVAFDLAIGRTVTTYSNATSIVINDKTNATPYPSAITVSGLQGAITKATVTLTNIYHSAPKDVSILLVAPTGQKTYLMSKTGGTSALKRVTLTFDDAAPSTLSTNQIVSGEYKPTALAYAAPPFPVPAPPGPYSTNLSVFNGLNPNGSWALYVYDDTQLDTGVISNGWVLNLTTSGPIPDSADLGIAMRASEDSVVATSNLVYSLAVTNFGPSTASNVFVTNTLPAGGVLLASQGSKGTFAVTSGKVVWNIGTLTLGGYATADLQVQANTVGTVLNAAEVTAFTADNNPANSYAEVRTLVTSPRADLTVGLVATPSPLMLGGNVTYLISVTNLGPASATALTVTHQLEAGVIPVSASPAGYVITTSGGASSVTFTNLGLLANDGVMNLEVVAKPTLAGTITGVTRVSSSAVDPLKGNNTAAAKTIVQPLSIGVVRSGAGLVLSWSANAANYTLEYADSLAPNAVWTAVPAAQISQASEWRSFRVETAAGSRYFRLKAQP